MLVGNISKTFEYLLLIVSDPQKKSLEAIFWNVTKLRKSENLNGRSKKHAFWNYLKFTVYLFLIDFDHPKGFERYIFDCSELEKMEILLKKIS